MDFRQYQNAEYRVFFENNTATLPKEAINLLGTSDVVISLGFCNDLRIYTASEFAEMKTTFDRLDAHEKCYLRAFFANAERADLTRGTIVVSKDLLNYANINKHAKIVFGSRNGTAPSPKEGCRLVRGEA